MKEVQNLCDMHCHILYGVDDGSKTEEMSVRMLRIAAEEGISDIILTPHYNPSRWPFDKAVMQERVERLQAICDQKKLGIMLYLGCEIFWHSDTAEALQKNLVCTMAGSEYVLIEFHPTVQYRTIREAVQTAMQEGLQPIVAHVERYDCLLSDPERVVELTELGALIQVNASSVMGENGSPAKRMTRKLLKWRIVHFIATDAHRDQHRAPHLQACAAFVTRKYGEMYANRIFRENPACVIQNEEIGE